MKFKFTITLAFCFIVLGTLLSACASSPSATDKPVVAGKPAAVDAPGVNLPPYIPLDKDDALHNAPGMLYEWWYLDAAFDNGYSMSTSWQIIHAQANGVNEPARIVQFAIYDPTGKKTDVDAKFSLDAVKASADSCDVLMGSNHLTGKGPSYDMDFRQGDLGCKLTFTSVTEGFKTPPDGVVYFSRQPEKYIGWVIAQPRAKVTGKLILNGKEIPVTGVGYHDHNWGNCPLTDMYRYWYWGRIFLPDYTFIYSIGEMADSLGGRPSSAILTFKGPKLLDVSTSITADASDLVLDSYTGAKYPQSLVLRPEGKIVKGSVTHKLRNLVETLVPPGAAPGEGRAYFRFLSDCDINLDIAGDKLQVKTPLLHEYMIP